MKPVTVTRHINAPVDRVEALFADLEHAADRIEGIKRVEMLSDGPFGVGTRWRETRVMFGKEATEEMEITEYAPGDHYVAEAESCGVHYRSVVRFEPSGEGTDVTMEFAGEPISFFARLMMPLSGLMRKTIIKCIEQDLADLAKIAEAAEQQAT